MTEKNTQALECGEQIYVINKSEISEYTVRKSKEYFYIKIYLKNGNSIYGSVENENIEFLISKLQDIFVNKIYIKEYKDEKYSFIKLLDVYNNNNKLIDFIL